MASFVKSAETISPGFGAASVTGNSLGNALTATATKTITLAQNISRGLVHIRQSAANAACTLQLQVTATDGTNTETIFNDSAARPAGVLSNVLIPFLSDLSYNSISVVATIGGTSPTTTLDIEVAGNP